MNQNPYPNANWTMNEQQLNQTGQALYSYCHVMREPKLGAAPILITVLTGLAMTLIVAALGGSLLLAVGLGAILIALFGFLCWLAYRYRVGASRNLNSYLAVDGGRMMISDFAYAQPFVNDQFRLGRYFLFIRNGAVLRIDGIVDVVKIPGRSGGGVSVKYNDQNGSMSFAICRLHPLGGWDDYYRIRDAVMQRRWQG